MAAGGTCDDVRRPPAPRLLPHREPTGTRPAKAWPLASYSQFNDPGASWIRPGANLDFGRFPAVGTSRGPDGRLPAARSAPVAQRIEHLTTDQEVGGSSPSGRATHRPRFTDLSCPFVALPVDLCQSLCHSVLMRLCPRNADTSAANVDISGSAVAPFKCWCTPASIRSRASGTT